MNCTYCGCETQQNPCAVCGMPLQGAPVPATVTEQPAQPPPAPYSPASQVPVAAAQYQAAAGYAPSVSAQPSYPVPQPQPYRAPQQPYAAHAPQPYPPAQAAYPAPQPYYGQYSYTPPVDYAARAQDYLRKKRLHPSVGGAAVITILGVLALLASVAAPVGGTWLLIEGLKGFFTGEFAGLANDFIYNLDLNVESYNSISMLFTVVGEAGGGAFNLLLGLLFCIFPPIFLLIGAPCPRSAPRRCRAMLITGACFMALGGGLSAWGTYKILGIIPYLPAPYSYAGHILLGGTVFTLLIAIIGAAVMGTLIPKSDAAHSSQPVPA